MSSIGTILAPASSVIAGTNNSPAPVKGDTGGQQAAASQNAVATGQAAGQSFSASSKNRATSTGDARQVDGSFEKQGIKDSAAKRQKKEKTVGKSLDVTA